MAKHFLEQGFFDCELGNNVLLALVNVLKCSIVCFSSIANYPVTEAAEPGGALGASASPLFVPGEEMPFFGNESALFSFNRSAVLAKLKCPFWSVPPHFRGASAASVPLYPLFHDRKHYLPFLFMLHLHSLVKVTMMQLLSSYHNKVLVILDMEN